MINFLKLLLCIGMWFFSIFLAEQVFMLDSVGLSMVWGSVVGVLINQVFPYGKV